MHEVESAAYAMRPAWHGLGVIVDHAMTSTEAIELAQLDWQVELREKFLSGEALKPLPDDDEEEPTVYLRGRKIPEDFAVLRISDGKLLGKSVGAQYRPIQNRQAFDFLDSLVQSDKIKYEAVGSLRGGQMVWMLARVKGEEYKVAGVDEMRPYILCFNTHDGSKAFRALPTAVRVVCANTVSLALSKGQGQGISIRHSGDVGEKLRNARTVWEETQRRFQAFAEQAEALTRLELNESMISDFLAYMFPIKDEHKYSPSEKLEKFKRVMEVRDILATKFVEGDGDPSLNSVQFTAWGMFNAVTRWTNHERRHSRGLSLRGIEGEEMQKRDARFESLLFGQGDAINQKALGYLIHLAN